MTTIKVERKYKLAFESVCELLKNGFLADGDDGSDPVTAYTDTDGKSIIDGEYRYVLGTAADEAKKIDEDSSDGIGFSWFAGLRDYTKVSTKSGWESLMEKVSRTYHKLYSLVEYKEKENTVVDKSVKDSCISIVSKLYGTFIPDRAGAAEVVTRSDNEKDDYYGVTLRADISGSTGSSVPILCKAYFKKVQDRIVPISRNDAQEVDRYLQDCVTDEAVALNDKIERTAIGSKDDIIPGTIGAVDELLKARKGITFEDAIYYAGKEDEEEIARLVKQTAHDGAMLRVVAAKILGISHVRWSSHAFDVKENGECTYRISLGINNMITLTCAGCGAMIIDKNEIRVPGEDGEEDSVIVLNPDAPNFGLSQDELDDIENSGVFSNHNYKLSCPENFRNRNCTQFVCLTEEEKVFSYERGDGTVVHKCKSCPYMEIVYSDEKGNRYYTPTLVYACDKHQMVEKASAHQCNVCKRYIADEESKRCPLCQSIALASGTPAARKLYKRYKGMLPITSRMFVAPGDKRAYEDEEVILFCMNKKRYIVHKTKLKDSGLNQKPEKL